jgi:glucose/arabinose dehydrogenase
LTRNDLVPLAAIVLLAPAAPALGQQRTGPACDPDDGGLRLPPGFCALVVADDIGAARHLAVRRNGDIFVAIRERGEGGRLLALRDTTGDGRVDVRLPIWESSGGTGIALSGDTLWFAPPDAVLRFRLEPGALSPAGPPDTVVGGLPADRSHRPKSIALARDGSLYVNVGSPSNACQAEDRVRGSPGLDPCPELATRAGIWRFDADAEGLSQSDGDLWATGLRNTVALAVRPADDAPWGVVHGRDQLHGNWPDRFDERQNAELPSEEMHRIERSGRYSWPYCYHDPERGLVLAPEYGGDGRTVGRCSDLRAPAAAFPAHWAPNALLFYDGTQFPERYRGGAFIAFHGSWNRAPLPQGGYNVVFQPFDGEGPAGAWERFADGFTGPSPSPREAAHRPSGLALGPDGSLYVADDAGGTIWRILYRSSSEAASASGVKTGASQE